jgi:hypothetical protein
VGSTFSSSMENSHCYTYSSGLLCLLHAKTIERNIRTVTKKNYDRKRKTFSKKNTMNCLEFFTLYMVGQGYRKVWREDKYIRYFLKHVGVQFILRRVSSSEIWRREVRWIISQKMILFIITAVKTSNPISFLLRSVCETYRELIPEL